MKHVLLENGVGFSGFVDLGDMTLTGKLLLRAYPQQSNEAVSKKYVDDRGNNLNADYVTSGVFSIDRLPAFSGGVSSQAGSNQLTLANTGVTPGVYTKVTFNASGLATHGTLLSAADIPPLNFSKIATGKPNTIAGYGIQNAPNRNTGTLSFNLTLFEHPVEPTDAASKQYVDDYVAALTGYVTGDIICRESSQTPAGFLRANGGELTTAAYSGLYAVIGDRFARTNLGAGSGAPWRHQYAFNLVGDTFDSWIASWVSAGVLPVAISTSQVIVTKNRVYLLGGTTSGPSYSDVIYTTTVTEDGNLGTWTTAGNIPEPLAGAATVVTKNRVYLMGGYNGTNYINKVYTAPINTDGTLGTWAQASNLPGIISNAEPIITKNRVYLMGGYNGSADVATVYTAPINADGTLGTWTTAGNLPGAIVNTSALVTKNRVYLMGGYNGSAYVATVYTAPINSDGTLGTWTTGASLPGPLSNPQAIDTRNRVYLLGGIAVSTATATVYTAPINSDGTLGTWSSGPSLSTGRYSYGAIVVANKLYLLGGKTNSTTFLDSIHVIDFAGGSNDYSPYYDGTIAVLEDPGKFRLPDYSTKPGLSGYWYIKY